MKIRVSIALFVGLACLVFSNRFIMSANQPAASVPPTSIPTFFYRRDCAPRPFLCGWEVGGRARQGADARSYVCGGVVPKKIRHPYPILFIQAGGGQTSIALLQTPDGRPGWAYDFVNQGYTVYMMDFPGRGRSAYIPGLDGT